MPPLGPVDSSLNLGSDVLNPYLDFSNSFGILSTGFPTPISSASYAPTFFDSTPDIWTAGSQHVLDNGLFEATDCFAPTSSLDFNGMALTATNPLALGVTVTQNEGSGLDTGMIDAFFPAHLSSTDTSSGFPEPINIHNSTNAASDLNLDPNPEAHLGSMTPPAPERLRSTTLAPRVRPLRPAPQSPLPSSSVPVPDPRITSPSASNTDSAPAPDDSIDYGGRKRKRERNTEAARRYRQRRVDQVDELQAALAKMTEERDALRTELAGAKAEAAVLRDLMGGLKRSDKGDQKA